jgi:hypothetical protein
VPFKRSVDALWCVAALRLDSTLSCYFLLVSVVLAWSLLFKAYMSPLLSSVAMVSMKANNDLPLNEPLLLSHHLFDRCGLNTLPIVGAFGLLVCPHSESVEDLNPLNGLCVVVVVYSMPVSLMVCVPIALLYARKARWALMGMSGLFMHEDHSGMLLG